jgi:membrane-associated phospholipid phosphatase
MLRVDSVVVFAAQYLLFIMVAGFAVFWLLGEDRAGKVRLGVAAVAGLVVGAALLVIAGKVHADPRPFVQNPALHPLFRHARDNGFPSDHSLAAGLIATLVLLRSRVYGSVFALAALCVAASRVAAHVHHVQDVAAGLALGAIAAVIGYYVAAAVLGRLRRLGRLPLAGDLNEPERPRRPARHEARHGARPPAS